jgi:multidrug efflux pump subunit AcrA (membrane-fusion protein)
MRNRKLQAALIGLVVLVGFALLPACAGASRNLPTPTPLPPVVNEEKIVFTVERGEIRSERDVVGEVVPKKQDMLFFRSPGTIMRMAVKPGDTVKAGDVLAELRMDDVLDQLQQAQLDLETARDNLTSSQNQKAYDLQKAESDVLILEDRVKLIENALARSSGSAREDAQLNLEIAQEQLKVAQAYLELVRGRTDNYQEQLVKKNELQVDRLERLVSERQIVAPYDGLVLNSYREAGADVKAFDAQILLGDPSELVIRIAYDAELSKILSPQTKVFLIPTQEGVEPYPSQFIPDFLPVSNPKTGINTSQSGDITFNYYYFSIPQDIPVEEIPFGRAIKLRVTLGEKADALLLPPAAIRGIDQFKYVIVLEGDRHRRVEVVQVGLKTSEAWEITANLQPGDQVLGP